ncbi:hypothetical protein [Rhodovibrio salinarum]|uniref:LPP20 lipoprotein n=1 Tax=Rhodovibrio salinarum TaxID=1087 RepID=A0A934QJV8_9PROT|nr:hypothetical protein [Rhodovibrio salinarum]MBK1698227.1 hypothetical protein [Rhodovibrio salinarum]
MRSYLMPTFLAAAVLAAPAVQAQTQSGAKEVMEPTIKVATDSRQQAATHSRSKTPGDLWQAWMDKNGITEGVNDLDNGQTFFIASGKAQVRADFGSNEWVNARQVAFNSALLAAKSEMANTVGAIMRSDRAVEVLQQGGDTVPPQLKQVRDQVSTLQRMRKLTNEALDAQIQKFDPDWQGKDEQNPQQKRVQLQERYQEKVAAGAQLLINGAMPVFNAEGDNLDKNYTVLVGIVWSPRMAALSSSIYNPNVEIPKGPKTASVSEQIEQKLQENPNFLALSQGARVWNEADGSKVIVSFAPVYRTQSSTINEQKAALIGRSQIAQFVAEDVASRQMSDSQNTFRAYDDGSSQTFNNNEFRSLIRAKAKQIRLQGAIRAYSWKGQHPAANVPMQTDVYVWSPDSRAMAQRLQELTGGQGASSAGGAGASGNLETGAGDSGDGNVAAPARSGAGSNVSNF